MGDLSLVKYVYDIIMGGGVGDLCWFLVLTKSKYLDCTAGSPTNL